LGGDKYESRRLTKGGVGGGGEGGWGGGVVQEDVRGRAECWRGTWPRGGPRWRNAVGVEVVGGVWGGLRSGSSDNRQAAGGGRPGSERVMLSGVPAVFLREQHWEVGETGRREGVRGGGRWQEMWMARFLGRGKSSGDGGSPDGGGIG